MCPVAVPAPGAPLTRKKQSNRDDRHADTTPSAPGQTTAALEAAAGCLRTHHCGPGRPGGLGHPAAPARTATPGTWGCPAHRHNRAGTHVHLLDHQHDHGADHRTLPTDQQPGHQPVRCQPADHHGGTTHHIRHATLEQHDSHKHPLHSWGHDATPRDHPEHHRADHHGRLDHHSSLEHHDRAHDHAADHDHCRAHHHRADHDQHRPHDDQHRADHDWVGNHDDFAGDP